jgi:hypothetical protein
MIRTPRRRGVLGGALAGLAGTGIVPLLEARSARGQAHPKRFVFFYTPNGTVWPEWARAAPGGGITFGRILAALEPFKAKVNVLKGVHMTMAEAGGVGSHHARGVAGLLTGTGLNRGNFETAGQNNAGWAKGISLDQELAKRIGGATRFKSLELGVMVNNQEVRGRISYAGNNQPLPPSDDPYAVFDRIFAGLSPRMGDDTMDIVRRKRKSVLDYVMGETAAARKKIGGRDREKLDVHIAALRDIEGRLAASAPAPTTCTPPMLGSRLEPRVTANMPAVGKLQMDLAAAALACDLTRIITLQWTWAESIQTFPWLGLGDFAHHTRSHAPDSDLVALEGLIKINEWYGQQFAYLLKALDSYPEGGGTMLDNTVVVWGIEVAKGNNHLHQDIPFVVAGRAGNTFRTGRFIDYGTKGRQHNDLLVAIAQAMGTDLRTFGDPAYVSGPLPDLT